MKLSLKKKKNLFDRILLIFFLCATVAALFFSIKSPIAGSLRRFERINMIWIGTDWVDYSRHSDTLMFVSYEPKARFLDILSIPRDTRIRIPGIKVRRINEVYAYFYRLSKKDHVACEKLKNSVEDILKSRETLQIPFYIQLNYEGFKQVVDLLGGVSIHIDEPMHYDDYSGNLHIHFSTGTVVLNGTKALEYVRYRGRSGDRGRIFRQQRFLRSALGRFKNPLVVLRIPLMFYRVISNIQTNLSLWDMIYLALDCRFLRKENIRFLELPGRPDRRRRYWMIDQERLEGVVNLITAPFVPGDYRYNGKVLNIDNEKIIVEVFNGSTHRHLAWDVTKMLRQKGVDVVNWGNYEASQQTTLVVDRTGNVRAAQAVAACLKKAEVISRIDRRRLVDVTVILGENYK